MMYYVQRDSGGAIIAIYANPQEDRTDPHPLPDTHPEVAAFLNPAPALPPLTSRQLRLGLITNGIALSAVDAAIGEIADEVQREIARVEWEYATTFERSHPLINQVGAALGLTPAQIDAMWQEATSL